MAWCVACCGVLCGVVRCGGRKAPRHGGVCLARGGVLCALHLINATRQRTTVNWQSSCCWVSQQPAQATHAPTSTLAAGLSTYTDFRMVAPSLVTVTSSPRLMLCRILSMPLGPSVDFTRSVIAMAPTNAACSMRATEWCEREATNVCVCAAGCARVTARLRLLSATASCCSCSTGA